MPSKSTALFGHSSAKYSTSSKPDQINHYNKHCKRQLYLILMLPMWPNLLLLFFVPLIADADRNAFSIPYRDRTTPQQVPEIQCDNGISYNGISQPPLCSADDVLKPGVPRCTSPSCGAGGPEDCDTYFPNGGKCSMHFYSRDEALRCHQEEALAKNKRTRLIILGGSNAWKMTKDLLNLIDPEPWEPYYQDASKFRYNFTSFYNVSKLGDNQDFPGGLDFVFDKTGKLVFKTAYRRFHPFPMEQKRQLHDAPDPGPGSYRLTYIQFSHHPKNIMDRLKLVLGMDGLPEEQGPNSTHYKWTREAIIDMVVEWSHVEWSGDGGGSGWNKGRSAAVKQALDYIVKPDGMRQVQGTAVRSLTWTDTNSDTKKLRH
jgi:hypothetical protein